MVFTRPQGFYPPFDLPPGGPNTSARGTPSCAKAFPRDPSKNARPHVAGPASPATTTTATPSKGKGKAGVPHTICYTVAGMPRPMKEDDLSLGGVNRGPRKGTVTALTTWSLRDLKVGL